MPSSRVPPPRPKRPEPPPSRREEILEAALELIAEHGVAGASLRMLAKELGMSQPSLYHYFPSKRRARHRDHRVLRAEDAGRFARARAAEVRRRSAALRARRGGRPVEGRAAPTLRQLHVRGRAREQAEPSGDPARLRGETLPRLRGDGRCDRARRRGERGSPRSAPHGRLLARLDVPRAARLLRKAAVDPEVLRYSDWVVDAAERLLRDRRPASSRGRRA